VRNFLAFCGATGHGARAADQLVDGALANHPEALMWVPTAFLALLLS